MCIRDRRVPVIAEYLYFLVSLVPLRTFDSRNDLLTDAVIQIINLGLRGVRKDQPAADQDGDRADGYLSLIHILTVTDIPRWH